MQCRLASASRFSQASAWESEPTTQEPAGCIRLKHWEPSELRRGGFLGGRVQTCVGGKGAGEGLESWAVEGEGRGKGLISHLAAQLLKIQISRERLPPPCQPPSILRPALCLGLDWQGEDRGLRIGHCHHRTQVNFHTLRGAVKRKKTGEDGCPGETTLGATGRGRRRSVDYWGGGCKTDRTLSPRLRWPGEREEEEWAAHWPHWRECPETEEAGVLGGGGARLFPWGPPSWAGAGLGFSY